MCSSGAPSTKLSAGVSETLIHGCYSRAFSATPSSHCQHTYLSHQQLQTWLMKPVVQLLPYITDSNDSPQFNPLQAWLCLASYPQPSAGCLGGGTALVALQDFGSPCWSTIWERTIWASPQLRAGQPGSHWRTKHHMRLYLPGTSIAQEITPTHI